MRKATGNKMGQRLVKVSLAMVFAAGLGTLATVPLGSVTPALATVAYAEDAATASNAGTVQFNGQSYDTLTQAFEAAKAGGTITLTDDLTITTQDGGDASGLTGDVTLDLNGHTVYGANNNIAIRMKNSAGGSLTITNGSIVATQGTYCTVGASNAELTLEGISLKNETQYGMSVKAFDGGHIVLRDCTSTSTNGSGAITAAGGTVDVYGGKYEQEGYHDHNSSLLAPSNGTGVINVYGGTFVAEGSGIYIFSSGGTINFFDGELSVTGNYPAVRGDIDNKNYPSASGLINISGGKISGSFASINSEIDVNVSGGSFFGSDGTVNSDVEQYLVPGMEFNGQTGEVSTKENVIANVTDSKGTLIGAYESLADAISSVPDGGTVALTKDASGNGVSVAEGTDFTLDLGGHTYTIAGETVGSPGTETNGFQLLKDSDITFKNGTITSGRAKILIQNYSNLTLEGVTFDGGASTQYTLSNNNGDIHIGKGTSIYAGEASPNVAFDVCRYASYPSVNVTVDEGAGAIVGSIELSATNNDPKDGFSLTINGGDLSQAELSVSAGGGAATVQKTPAVALPAPEGYAWVNGELHETGEPEIEAAATITDAGGNAMYFTSLEEAVSTATSGSTITLQKDVEASRFTLPDGVTLDGNGFTIKDASAATTDSSQKTFILMGDGAVLKDVTLDVGDNNNHGVQFYQTQGGSLQGVTVNGGKFTSVMVNGSTGITISDSVLNPDDDGYANIEYNMGVGVGALPELTLDGVTFKAGKPQVYVDTNTTGAIKDVLGDTATESVILDEIISSITNKDYSDVQVVARFTRPGQEDPAVVTGVVVGAPTPVTPPSRPSYSVTAPEAENGTVEVSPERATAGTKVTVTPDPDDGFMVSKVDVTDKDGKAIEVVANPDGTYTFEMPAGGATVKVTFACDGGELCPSRHLVDVDQSEWYHASVDWAVESGLMSGYSDGSNTFGPDDELTRAQLAQMLYNQAGKPASDGDVSEFSDCASGEWYAPAVAWAVDQGVFKGYDDGSGRFGPNDVLTREQLAVVFWRIAGEPAEDADLTQFPDGSETHAWAADAVEWAVSTGLLQGYDNTGELDPTGVITRAQAATAFMREAESE